MGARKSAAERIEKLRELIRYHDRKYYGEAARKATDKRLLGLARWGGDSAARMALRTTAMKAKMPYSVFASREEAVAAVEKMKAERIEKK